MECGLIGRLTCWYISVIREPDNVVISKALLQDMMQNHKQKPQTKLTDTENRLVVARKGGKGLGERERKLIIFINTTFL